MNVFVRKTVCRWNRFAILAALVSLSIGPGQSFAVVSDPEGPPLERKSGPTGFEAAPGEVLVKFREGVDPEEKKRAHSEADAEMLSELPDLRVQRVKSKKGETTGALIEKYKRNAHVEYAEPNGYFQVHLTPNDPYFSSLWGLHNTGQTVIRPDGASFVGTADADIDAPEAWDRQTGSPDVVVADIDSGADYTHPDLAANIWTNPGEIPGNGLDDDGNGYIDDIHGWDFANNDNDPMDDHGHGTHTSGTIAGVGNNGIGVVGVSWRAKIMAAKFITNSGSGSFFAAAEAILYASRMGARVSNNSWGCYAESFCFSQVIEDAIAVANQRGMLFVVSAGNAGTDNDQVITYPCNSTQPNVLCVAATDPNDLRASFSNYGATTVDLGAPGVNVYSTVPTNGAFCCADPSGYKFLNGTSMAAPHVSGAAAVVLAQFPALTTGQLRAALMGSVDPNSDLAGKTVTGGRLNLLSALVSNFKVGASPSTQTVNRAGRSVHYTVTVESLKGFSAPVSLSLNSGDPKVSGSFSPNPVTPAADGSVSSDLTVTTSSTAVPGPYTLTITGNSQGEAHTAKATLVIAGADFTVSVNPAEAGVIPGGSTTYTVTVTSVDGYSKAVNLSLSSPNGGITGTFSPAVVTPPSGGTATSTLTVLTTGAVPYGRYTLTVNGIDSLRTRSGVAALVVGEALGVDLTVTDVQVQSSTGAPAGWIPMTATVKNRGIQGTPIWFFVYFYLSADTVMDSSDILLGGPQVRGGIGPGEIKAFPGGLQVPNLPEGTYYIWALVDSLYEVYESDEGNNTLLGNSFVIRDYASDLVVTSVSGSTSGIAGATILVTDTFLNQGTGQAVSHTGSFCGEILDGFYLSTDATITREDIPIGYRSTCETPLPGQSSTGTVQVTIPVTVPAGTYYLGAYVDFSTITGPDGFVRETNENNNSLVGNQVTVGVRPDLTYWNNLTIPASARRGSAISITDEVRNVGSDTASGFQVAYYLSLDGVVDSGDTLLGRRFVDAVAPGTVSGATTTVTIPATQPVGNYFVIGFADEGRVVTELDEENNLGFGLNLISITRK